MKEKKKGWGGERRGGGGGGGGRMHKKDGDYVHLLFLLKNFTNGAIRRSYTEILRGREDISFKLLHITEEYKAHQHTFKSLPEYPSVILATDSRSTSGVNVSLDSRTFKIFSLFDASGRLTIILSIIISAKS